MVKVILASSAMFDARSFRFPLFVHFFLSSGFDLGVIGNHKTDDHCDL